jgi:hypothetical protein
MSFLDQIDEFVSKNFGSSKESETPLWEKDPSTEHVAPGSTPAELSHQLNQLFFWLVKYGTELNTWSFKHTYEEGLLPGGARLAFLSRAKTKGYASA